LAGHGFNERLEEDIDTILETCIPNWIDVDLRTAEFSSRNLLQAFMGILSSTIGVVFDLVEEGLGFRRTKENCAARHRIGWFLRVL